MRKRTEEAERPNLEPAVYSVDEFCARYRMSRSTFYKLLREGDGPAFRRVGCKAPMISKDAAEAWWRQAEISARAVAPAEATL